jgi:CHAT domain-containing protein/tetratricopeptide (TPR) repeat protein
MALQRAIGIGLRRILVAGVLTVAMAVPVHAQASKKKALEQWQQLTKQVEVHAFQTGNFVRGIALAEEAVRVARRAFGDLDPRTLTSRNALAFLYRAQGRNAEAEKFYKETLSARQMVLGLNHPDTLQSLNNLAVLYLAQARYAEAEPVFREVLAKQREVLGIRDFDTIATLNNLASVLRGQGRYGEAEPLFREAYLQGREAFGLRSRLTLTILGNLGGLYVDQKRYRAAEPLYKAALQGNREVHGLRHPDTLQSLDHLAVLYDYMGRKAEAEFLYQEALRLKREVLGFNHPNTIDTLSNLGIFYGDQERFDEAEPLLREALQASRKVHGSSHYLTLSSLDSIGGVYVHQGRYSDAESFYNEALRGRREILGRRHPDTLSTQMGMVRLFVNQDRHAEAVQTLREIEFNLLSWIGQEVHTTESGRLRRQLSWSQVPFQNAVLTLATAKESSKEARLLAATMMLRFKVLQSEEEVYLARLSRQPYTAQVQVLAQELGKLRAALAENARGTPEVFESTLKAMEAKRQALVAASPDYRNRLRSMTASVDDVLRVLPTNAALIEFRQFFRVDFRTGELGDLRMAGLLLGVDEPMVLDLGSVSELQQLATGLDDQAATKLYERLIAAFEGKILTVKTVYLAPDGFLNLVPFVRLKLPDGSYWWEQQEVRLLQTGRDLLRPGADIPTRGLLALGGVDFDATSAEFTRPDNTLFAAAGLERAGAITSTAGSFAGFAPLPASVDEIKDVSEWYELLRADEPVEVWSGADASKYRLMNLKAPPRVLHLATHGFYRPNQSRDPMLSSGIALAGANRGLSGRGGDGIMFALEVEGLNLDGTELVVVSACDSAQGSLDYSEGVFGLARALRTAGARNVLVTLWKLKDGEAREFMVEFYKNWLTQERSDSGKSLRDTQLQWMKSGRDPKTWSPYVLIE